MNKMKKILENWQRAVTERAKQPITPEQIEQTMNQVIEDASIALDQMDSLPSNLFDEVGEEGSPERKLFEAYGNAYGAINKLRKAFDDSIISAREKENETPT